MTSTSPPAAPTPVARDEERERIILALHQTLDAIMWQSLQFASGLLKQYEMTLPQAMALGAIVRLGPDVDMGRITAATGLPASTTTSIVDRLVQRGLAERSPHPTDRRRILVSATRNGVYLLGEMDQHDINTWRWLARDVDTADLSSALAAFQQFLQRLEEFTLEDFERLRAT